MEKRYSMERFCHNCGSLVSGEGVFCPQCGGRLDAFDLNTDSNASQTEAVSTGVNLQKPVEAAAETTTASTQMPEAGAQPVYTAPVSTTGYTDGASGYTNNTYSYNPNNTAPYVNTSNATVQPEEMTVGQWVLTLFLSGLGIIGIILLFVWGFSDNTPLAKKNFSRAMLIWYAISVGLVILFWIIGAACAISIPLMFADY